MWLSLLTNKYVIIGIIVALLGTYIVILRGQVATCKAEKDTLTAELQVSQASVKSLQQAINDQNAAVEKLKADADAREKAGQVEIAKAKDKADTFKKQASDLLKKVAPQGVAKCDAANQLINQEIRNAK